MNRPQRERVYLAKLDKEVTLNFITLADDKYIFDTWGDSADKLYRTMNVDMVLALFWRLLSGESKAMLSKVIVEDWTGLEPKTLTFEEPISKLKHLVSSTRELFVIWNAINECRKKSDPEILDNDLKKKTVGNP